MDRSLHSPFSVKSPFSPRSRQNISSKRILPTSFRKSSRLSVSGKSAQSVQIVLKSMHNYVERFGQPLPVLVTEALTFAERNTVISAGISECGYAWVVCGRRLLIWQYRQTVSLSNTPQRKPSGINQCFELQLPQSDLAHRAELVSVFPTPGTSTPSCIAVSPEGLLRYWPAVAHEGVTVEQSVDLQGQECDSLTNVEGLGCILATTTCSVVLVQPQFNNGRHTLYCKPLKTPSGWFGGISRRMSSLIFGPISSEQSTETRLVRVLSVPNKDGTWTVYVLAGHSLQKWLLSTQEAEQLVCVTELNRLVRDSFHSAVWDNCVGDQAEIDTWLLDLQSDKDGVIILAAAVNMQMTPQVHYAMISFATSGLAQIRDFLLLKMSGLYREDNPSDSLSYRFLLCGTQAYLYNSKTITVVKPQEEPDVLEFTAPQDFLLGGSICVNTPVFFSRLSGLVAVYGNEQIGDYLSQSMAIATPPTDTSFNDSFVANNLSVYNVDPDEIASAYKDTIGQLKAAFIFHIRNQQSAYQEIINELFSDESLSIPSVDNTLDKIVLMMCKDLLDDIPVGDPRWTKDAPLGIGSSHSMQVLHQLEDKQKALFLFIKFLKDSGLWNRLSGCMLRDYPMATVYAVGEMSEKICSAIVLKSLPNSLILENAIEKAIKSYETEPGNGLTHQDVFYREVSKIHLGLQELVNCCEDTAHSDLSFAQVAQIVHDTNEIVLTVLNEVIQHRTQNSDSFIVTDGALTLNLEYLPWTAANGDEGVADALLLQHNLTYNYGLKLTSNGQLRNSLLDHFVGLTDLILDGRKSHLESIRNNQRETILYKQYCTDRHKLIKPLLNEKEWEKAALLAEKYLDFESLVIICEVTDNQNRLDEYMDKFSNDGFSEYVYNWFLKQNRQGKLIDRYRKSGKTKHVQKLTSFLNDHPSLCWMQQMFDKQFDMASHTLLALATAETESLTRQKTILSLSKLAKLAGPDTEDVDTYVDNINASLDLITFQEDLPDYVLQQFGYDTTRPRVLSPKELINIYICKEYSDAGELEFKKALDILTFINEDDLKEELHLKIWRSAILRDSWDYKNLDSPMEALQGTLFFKLIEISLVLVSEIPMVRIEFETAGILLYLMAGTSNTSDLQTLLPPLNLLLEDSSMQELQVNNNFEFLIKTAYEHVARTTME